MGNTLMSLVRSQCQSPIYKHILTIFTSMFTDSYKIALYLEKTYPNTRSIFPHSTLPLQHIAKPYISKQVIRPFGVSLYPLTPNILDDRGAEYFIRTREEEHGKLSELVKDSSKNWADVHDGFAAFAELLEMNDVKEAERGPFVMGKEVSYADFLVVSWIHFVHRLDGGKIGTNSMEGGGSKFKAMMEWQGGRWKTFWDGLEEYML